MIIFGCFNLFWNAIIWDEVIFKDIFRNIISNLSQWSCNFKFGILNIIKHPLILPMSWDHWKIENWILINQIWILIILENIIVSNRIYAWHHISLVLIYKMKTRAPFFIYEVSATFIYWKVMTCEIVLLTHFILWSILYALLTFKNSFHFI